jgi:hypothetical protein
MKYLKIQNNGLLDIRLIALMGGTTKRNNEYKIGQFGTGLKYSLAYLIRNKVDFKIFIGEKQVEIVSKKEIICGQEFDIIYIDGEKTSVTAQMGFDWNPWMIIREIWCNALDEGGATKGVFSECSGSGNTTTFCIELNIEFAKVWQNWSKYFVQEFEPLYSDSIFSIYSGGDTLRLYKQGILIHENKDIPAVFSYDIKNAELNELREFKGHVNFEVSKCLHGIKDNKIITNFIETVTDKHYEGQIDLSWYSSQFNDEWKTAIGKAKIIHPEAVKNIEARGLEIDYAASVVVPKNLYSELTKQFDGIGALRIADKVNDFFEIHSEELELKIKQALAILDTCGYFVDPELKFIYGVFGDKTVFASVNIDRKEILVSERLLDRPLFQVISTIIEENEHYRTAFSDHTREFQQHFIDLFTKTLLEKNEVHI